MINEKTISVNDKKIISSTPEQTQYRTIQEKTVAGEKVYIVDVDADDKDRSLSESIKNIGPIDDTLYAADGVTVIDGRHRLAECPNVKFTKRILENVKTEDQIIIVDLAKNCNRRPVPPEEKRLKIGILATKYHKTINQIVAATGIGHTTIDRYYPSELKDKTHSQAGIESGKARAVLKALVIPELGITTQQPGILTPIETTIPEPKELIIPCDTCSNDSEKNGDCHREHFHVDDKGTLVCERKKPVVPTGERQALSPNEQRVDTRPTQEPTAEEKIDALNTAFDREQQTLEKLIHDAKAEFPDDFKRAVYDLAFNPAKELTEKRLNDCLTVTLEVLLDFIEQQGTLQELLKTASEKG